MRRKRNELTYEAGVLVSKTESEKAFKDAIVLVQEVLESVKLQNPQISIKFEI